jgi:hypothetical protein
MLSSRGQVDFLTAYLKLISSTIAVTVVMHPGEAFSRPKIFSYRTESLIFLMLDLLRHGLVFAYLNRKIPFKSVAKRVLATKLRCADTLGLAKKASTKRSFQPITALTGKRPNSRIRPMNTPDITLIPR